MRYRAVRAVRVQEFDEFTQDQPPLQRFLMRSQFRVRLMVQKPWFDNMFLMLIIFNTILLAMEYDGGCGFLYNNSSFCCSNT